MKSNTVQSFIRLILLLIIPFLVTACTKEEAKISKRQQAQINRIVEYKVDSIRKAQQAICYKFVLQTAKPMADSIILGFEYEAINEALDNPEKPQKPEKPEVEIPVFDD